MHIAKYTEVEPSYKNCHSVAYAENFRGGQGFVTIVWRHKSTLGKCRRHDHSRGVRGHAPRKILQTYT